MYDLKNRLERSFYVTVSTTCICTNISEDSLTVKAGDEVRTLSLDNMLKRQEDAKRAAMTAANKNPRRR